MKYSRLEPLKMVYNDITRAVFLDTLFLCSWYKFDFFPPFSQLWNDFNIRRNDLRKQSSGIYVLENLQSHFLNPRINFSKSVQIKVILEIDLYH